MTIEFWSLGPESAIQATIAAFEAKHPNIQVEYFMPGGHDDFWRRLSVAVASGVGPDVVRSKDYFMTELAARGALLQLDPYIERDWAEIDWSADPLFARRVKTHASYEGKTYGLPFHVWWSMFHYNKRLLDEAGLGRPPETWDELRQWAEKLTLDLDGNGRIDQWGTQMYTYTRSEPVMVNWTFYQFLIQNGQLELFTWEDGIPVYHLNTPEAREALQFWVDNIYTYGITTPPELVTQNMNTFIQNERLAMWYTGHFAWGDFERDMPDLPWEVSVLPGKVNRGTIVEGNNAYIFANTKHPEAAWEFLKFLTSVEADLIWANPDVGYATLPWHDRNWALERYQTIPRYVESIRQIQEHPAPMMELHIGINEVQSKIAEHLQRAFHGRASVEQVLADAQADADRMIAEYYGTRRR